MLSPEQKKWNTYIGARIECGADSERRFRVHISVSHLKHFFAAYSTAVKAYHVMDMQTCGVWSAFAYSIDRICSLHSTCARRKSWTLLSNSSTIWCTIHGRRLPDRVIQKDTFLHFLDTHNWTQLDFPSNRNVHNLSSIVSVSDFINLWLLNSCSNISIAFVFKTCLCELSTKLCSWSLRSRFGRRFYINLYIFGKKFWSAAPANELFWEIKK